MHPSSLFLQGASVQEQHGKRGMEALLVMRKDTFLLVLW